MEAVVSAENLKILQDALICLNKLGESLNLQALSAHIDRSQGSNTGQLSVGRSATNSNTKSGARKEVTVRLSAVNSTSSAFCAFVFSDDFFESIELLGDSSDGASSGSSKVECQVNIRSLLASLKTNSAGGRKLDKCELTLTDGGIECRLSVRLRYQHGVTKTHKLTYEAQAAVFPSANPDPGSVLVLSPQTVLEWLTHFAVTARGADFSLWCGSDFCTVRSKSDDFETGRARKSIQTEVKVETAQFEVYNISEEAFLTLPLREFRAAVMVAESLMTSVELHFSVGGDPLFIRIFGEALNVEMVIATTDTKPPGFQKADAQPQRHMQKPVMSSESIHNSAPPRTRTVEASPSVARDAMPIQRVPSRSASAAQQRQEPDDQEEYSAMPESQAPMPSLRPVTTSQRPRESTPPPAAELREDSSMRSNAEATMSQTRGHASLLAQDDNSDVTMRDMQGSQGALSQTLFRGEVPASQETMNRSANASSSAMAAPPTRKIARPSAAVASRSVSVPTRALKDGFSTNDNHTAEAGDDSFDYGGAFDEMEKGLEAGDIRVHGSQQSVSGPAAGPTAASRQGIPLEANSDLLGASPPLPSPPPPPPAEDETLDDAILEDETIPGTQHSQSLRVQPRGVSEKRYRPMFG